MTIDHDPGINEADEVILDEDDGDAKDERPARRRLRHAMQVSRRWLGRLLARWRVIALTLAVVGAVGLAGGLFFFRYLPNQQTNDAAAHAAVRAASEGTAAVLSYSPENVDNDLALAKSHLTGDFLKYFNDFGRYFLAPAVRQQGVKASATVVRAAVVEMHPDSAVVLLFVHQTSSNKDKPEPVLTTSSVRATLTKVNGSWLISKFEPE
jgi:Mce-associated membrane protein